MESNQPAFNDEQAKSLGRKTQHLHNLLKNQREELRRKGMDLPPGTMKSVEQIIQDLTNIPARILEQYNELERLRNLANTTSIVNSSLDLDETLTSVLDTVLQMTNAERGYIMLRNDDTDKMEIRVARGMQQQDLDVEQIIVSDTIVDEVMTTGNPIVTTNAQQDERFARQQSVVGYNLRSILCVPLIIKGTVEGVVYADNRIQAGLFGNKELQLLVAVANQSALAIENAKLFEQARTTLEQITEFKTLQDNILSSIISGVITTDANNSITTYNPGAEVILGHRSEEATGTPLSQALPVLYPHIKDVLPTIQQQDEAVTLEIQKASPNSEAQQNLNLRLSPLKDANNGTQGIALVIDDLTEQKRRDAMLQAVRRYLPPVMVDNIQSIDNLALGGERREVTAIFVEVLPQAAFQDENRADEIMDLLNLYLTVGTDVIHRRAGLIDKYMGSEIMGLFNTQLNPSSDHAFSAVLAAIDIVKEFNDLYHESLQDPYFRMGIHTGIATMGNVGGTHRREFTAIGDTINLAKRLEENADPKQIIISKDTYDQCVTELNQLSNVSVTPQDNILVKGRSQLTQIFEIKLV